MKILPLAVAFVFVAAGAAYVTQDPATPAGCNYDPTLMQRGTRLAASAGSAVHDLSGPVPTDKIQDTVQGTWHTLGYWFGTFGAAVQGKTAPEQAPQPCPGGTSTGCEVPTETGAESSDDQKGIARIIANVADERGLSDRAKVIAIATGFQESGLKNISYGDRDSVGVFQQRAGWGSVAERMNVRISAGKFFDHLVRVNGWESVPLTRAAQAVQISAYPDAYAKWEDEAEALLASIQDPNYANVMAPLAAAPAGLVQAVATTDDPPEAQPDPLTEPLGCVNPNVTAASWNVAHWNSGGNVLDGVQELVGQAGSIGLQEVDDSDRGRIKRWLPAGWRMSDGMSSTPVIWDGNRYTYLGQEQKVVLERTRVELGTDGYTIPQKTMNTVELVDVSSGVRFAHVNFHLPPSTGSEGGKDSPSKPKRFAAYRLEKARVIAKVRELRASGFSVIATCDCNRQDDLDNSFAAAGMKSSGTEATHGNRTLDFVYAAGMAPSSESVLSRGYGSDHDAVLATFTADAPAGSTAAAIGVGPAAPSSWDSLNPRTPVEAVATLRAMMPSRSFPGFGIQGHCEGYMNRAYGRNGGYGDAVGHWNAPGPKGTGTPPLGALVFFDTSNVHGHVAMSSGGGRVISTDYDSGSKRYRAGVIGEGTIAEVAQAMGGKVLGWRAPSFVSGSGV